MTMMAVSCFRLSGAIEVGQEQSNAVKLRPPPQAAVPWAVRVVRGDLLPLLSPACDELPSIAYMADTLAPRSPSFSPSATGFPPSRNSEVSGEFRDAAS